MAVYIAESWEMIRRMFAAHGYDRQFDAVKAYYESESKGDINGIDEAFINFATDYAFFVPALKVARAHMAYNDVWMYHFEYVSDFAKEMGLLAGHAMDLPYDFNAFGPGVPGDKISGGRDPVRDMLVEEIHMSWVRFIKTGMPNGDKWPQYTGEGSSVRIFDVKSCTEQPDHRRLMELWGDMKFYEA